MAMNAKMLLFVSSIVFVVVGVAGLAALGALAKVPSPEYWPVVGSKWTLKDGIIIPFQLGG